MIQIPAMAILDRVRRFVPPEVWLVLAAFALLVGFFVWAYFSGVEAQKDRQAVEGAKVERRASTGRETASIERFNDALTIQAEEKALTDATAPFPSTAPSPQRLALACERLRQQRSVLPERCGPDGTP